MDSMWGIAEVCMIVFYLCAIVVAVRHLLHHWRDCFTCTYPQAWLRSALLAFLVTPSLISDFFLFALPGPAALGFALMFPAVLFGSGHRLEVLAMISVLYVLPLIAGTTIIFYVWRMMRWRSLSRRRAPHEAKDNRPLAAPAKD